MAGSVTGGKKTAKTNIEKYGPNYYKKVGRLGGIRRVPKGFAMMTPEQRAEAGRKGGTISRRKKSE